MESCSILPRETPFSKSSCWMRTLLRWCNKSSSWSSSDASSCLATSAALVDNLEKKQNNSRSNQTGMTSNVWTQVRENNQRFSDTRIFLIKFKTKGFKCELNVMKDAYLSIVFSVSSCQTWLIMKKHMLWVWVKNSVYAIKAFSGMLLRQVSLSVAYGIAHSCLGRPAPSRKQLAKDRATSVWIRSSRCWQPECRRVTAFFQQLPKDGIDDLAWMRLYCLLPSSKSDTISFGRRGTSALLLKDKAQTTKMTIALKSRTHRDVGISIAIETN